MWNKQFLRNESVWNTFLGVEVYEICSCEVEIYEICSCEVEV